jgi:hypothetical protein
MHYYMDDAQTTSLAGMSAFVAATQALDITNTSTQEEKYRWVDRHLTQTRYLLLPRSSRRAIKTYIAAGTGLSRAQVTRLVAQKKETGTVMLAPRTQPIFPTTYTPTDIALLAQVDEAHCVLSGPATKKIFQREFMIFGKAEYGRLSKISVSHLYNLRGGTRYAHSGVTFTMTKKSKKGMHIGIRKKPENGGKPGYLRVDSVHQGDLEKQKGVYHVNLVDEVTQWEIVMTVERIAESFLDVALGIALDLFPFTILGFHSDNGSEYINETVAELLRKLLVEQTKSRARRSNDNGLAETKNGAVVRKLFGYAHIPQNAARIMDTFNRAHLDVYLNYHRPCGFATATIDHRGKEKKKYDVYMTPFEKLKSLGNWTQFLVEGVTSKSLEKIANNMSDTECAALKEKGRALMFDDIRKLTNPGV